MAARLPLFVASFAGLALFVAPNVARAQATNEVPEPKAWMSAPPTRRGGFITSFEIGGGVAGVAGFPNDVAKKGLARYYTSTGPLAGGSGTLWIGGALTDYFNFGLGLTMTELASTGNKIDTSAFVFRIEGFPLFPVGGAWRDLGVDFTAGAGSVSLATDADPDHKLVDGGAASMIGGGVFFEGIRFSRFAMGPSINANYFWSDSVRRPGVFAGWRAILYAAKIKK